MDLQKAVLIRILVPAAILISGILWYLSFELSGAFGWMIWIAPVPILYISFQLPWKKAFAISFAAYMIGRLSWLPYLLSVLPVLPALLFTLILPLIFATVVVQTRKAVLAQPHWLSVFVFPVLWTAFEYLAFVFSPDGTAGSIAYSQSNFLPVIQVASVTGIAGIDFLILLFPSSIALIWHYRHQQKVVLKAAGIVLLITAVALGFGTFRIISSNTDTNLKVGMIVEEEALHEETDKPDLIKARQLADLYLEKISSLADEGIQLAVLPEKTFVIEREGDPSLLNLFTTVAAKKKIAVILGITEIGAGRKTNNAVVISNEGKIVADYQKVNLFEGEILSGFNPGKEKSVFLLGNIPSGVAICKDLDFEQYIRKYSQPGASVLYVPAWDFVRDDWMHARMAILRGVENGFSMVRVARQGRLTISDHLGRVLSEASSAQGKSVTHTGSVPLPVSKTVYSKTGDWFGIATVMAAFYFLVFYSRERKADISG